MDETFSGMVWKLRNDPALLKDLEFRIRFVDQCKKIWSCGKEASPEDRDNFEAVFHVKKHTYAQMSQAVKRYFAETD